MCNYQGYEFGAGRYPDSVCIDGRLLDADNCDGRGNLYDNEEDIPCPLCRPTAAVSYWAEQHLMIGDVDHEEALAMATSRVIGIREKRGVFDEFAPPAETCNDLTSGD